MRKHRESRVDLQRYDDPMPAKDEEKLRATAETVPEPGAPRGTPGGDPRFLNRELSWLDFAERVLRLAEDKSRPALERAKFLAIFSRSLDEFFQIRVSGLREQALAGVPGTARDGMSPREQLDAIRDRVLALVARQTQIFERQVRPLLKAGGVQIVDWDDLKKTQREALSQVFEERVYPVLTPLAVDPAHPFPYISDLSLNLAVVVRDRETGSRRFARV
jgi:polyphosphate kinase